jgi:hypothetical protein
VRQRPEEAHIADGSRRAAHEVHPEPPGPQRLHRAADEQRQHEEESDQRTEEQDLDARYACAELLDQQRHDHERQGAG